MSEANGQMDGGTADKLLYQGYAPGDYFNNCMVCKKDFLGAKRAAVCFYCACTRDDELAITLGEVKSNE